MKKIIFLFNCFNHFKKYFLLISVYFTRIYYRLSSLNSPPVFPAKIAGERGAKLNTIKLFNNILCIKAWSVFSHLACLTSLHLDNNFIETIGSSTFANLSKIELISLKSNQIKSISDNAFHLINPANKVDLYNNTELSHITATSLTGIDYLRFSYKSLLLLTNNSHLHFDVANLDLSQSRIALLATNSLKGLFAYLNLAENSLTSLETNAFARLPNLARIDFGHNLLANLSFEHAFQYEQANVTALNFKWNKIKTISAAFFRTFPRLNRLDLSENSLLGVSKSYFACLTRLRRLDLSGNHILTIEHSSFATLEELTHLNLTNNLVYELSADLFSNLTQLEELKLGKNKLEFVYKDYFRGLVSLKHLDLSENLLRTLPRDTFAYLTSMRTLRLNANRIRAYACSSLEQLEFLDLSRNQISTLNFNVSLAGLARTLSHLDLSRNEFGHEATDLGFFACLRVLHLSETNSAFVLSLRFRPTSSIEDLDLSGNDLALLPSDYFANLGNLRRLNLRGTNLVRLDFGSLFEKLVHIDLSDNLRVGTFLGELQYSPTLETLKISNVTLLSFNEIGVQLVSSNVKLQHLDASFNRLDYFDFVFASVVDRLARLDLSHNNFSFLVDDTVDIKPFAFIYQAMTAINLEACMSRQIADKVVYLSKLVEHANLAQNSLSALPKFCQVKVKDSSVECQLRYLNFGANTLRSLSNADLVDLVYLTYLNLESNSISVIESDAFVYLSELDTLTLAHNKLTNLTSGRGLFSYLNNLKLLNLSFNSLETVSSFLFANLLKLETLDLSHNVIRLLADFAFYELNSLHSLYLNENSALLRIENQSFVSFDSIQNVYMSRSTLTRQEAIFVALFDSLNRDAPRRNKRLYFKSLSLIATYERYDCELTLYFMRQNVHFNFKSEAHITDYLQSCAELILKRVVFFDQNSIDRNVHIFTDASFYFIVLCIFLIIIAAAYLNVNG